MIGDVIFIGAVITTMTTIFSIVVNMIYKRIERIEDALHKSEKFNRSLWVWCRNHLDLYYQFRTTGAPEPKPLPEDE